jgi:hypothetical protein
MRPWLVCVLASLLVVALALVVQAMKPASAPTAQPGRPQAKQPESAKAQTDVKLQAPTLIPVVKELPPAVTAAVEVVEWYATNSVKASVAPGSSPGMLVLDHKDSTLLAVRARLAVDLVGRQETIVLPSRDYQLITPAAVAMAAQGVGWNQGFTQGPGKRVSFKSPDGAGHVERELLFVVTRREAESGKLSFRYRDHPALPLLASRRRDVAATPPSAPVDGNANLAVDKPKAPPAAGRGGLFFQAPVLPSFASVVTAPTVPLPRLVVLPVGRGTPLTVVQSQSTEVNRHDHHDRHPPQSSDHKPPPPGNAKAIVLPIPRPRPIQPPVVKLPGPPPGIVHSLPIPHSGALRWSFYGTPPARFASMLPMPLPLGPYWPLPHYHYRITR